MHDEAHCNDLWRHFPSIDNQEHKINDFNVIGNNIHFFIQSKEETIDQNDKENEAIEPRVYWYNLNDLVSDLPNANKLSKLAKSFYNEASKKGFGNFLVSELIDKEKY